MEPPVDLGDNTYPEPVQENNSRYVIFKRRTGRVDEESKGQA